jgi:hypothetical protein
LTQITQMSTDDCGVISILKCLERRELISPPGIFLFYFYFFEFDLDHYQIFDVSRSLAVPLFNPKH